MSRHRNIRALCDDDVDTYDEAFASSVDDDYTISPNTSERYIYNPDSVFKQDISVSLKNVKPLSFTAEDFPENDSKNLKPEDSPGVVSGRIGSCQAFDFSAPKTNEVTGQNDSVHGSDEVFGNSDLFDSSNFKRLNTSVVGEDNLVNSTISVNKSKVEELDFELLDRLTSQSSSAQQSFEKPFKTTVSVQDTTNRLKSKSTDLHFLSKTTNLFSSNCSISKLAGITTYDIPTKNINSAGCLIGYKTPSFFGLLMSSYTADKSKGFDGMLSRFSNIIVRTRSPIYNYLFAPRTVSGFVFDIPEPKTFERGGSKLASVTTKPCSQRKLTAHALCVPQARPTEGINHADTSLLNLSLSQKLTISSHSDERSNFLRTPGNNSATPSKPIDRHSLVNEYSKLHKESAEKEIINLIVMGHVDAGKSTLMGNLLCLLGHVSSKQLAKYQWDAQKLGKASFAYAWILDQTSEERNRGVTMDIAQTSFETKSKRVALMDAPGHKDFVPQVIGGATQADAALLVINATRGEFETGIGAGGQTREHARLARLLGVSRLIVAVNKMDTVEWCQSRFNEIQTQISSFLKSMNFSGVVYCPVSGLVGANLVPQNLSNSSKNTSETGSNLFAWYTGPSLLELIDSIPSPDRTVDGPFRFVVSDIFKPAGSSVPMVAGRVISGAISSGVNIPTSKVICLPSDVRTCVKSIRSLCNTRTGQNDAEGDLGGKLLDQVVKFAFAGDQVALMLTDIDPFQTLIPGDLLTDPDNLIQPSTCISAKLLVFSIQQPITKGYPVIYYYNCANVAATITKLKSMTRRENKMEKVVRKPRCLLGNCTANVELTFERPICIEVYEKCKPLGRFMLRVGGESIAGGTVTKLIPSKKEPSC
ncbi:HBS1-like protein, variant 3 [Schistosoma haematobium]|uniref:HBS1-like protein, variant 3 n=1 Tax=Schistosoma haematobium TaxID=6185 RepID=A0A922LM68_SCHHA|nr:HBS1-like protein, variant 3 [Schistosoma haematobium]KAH9589589.1 HBS1-like protein, variant 3 [Schistosoma haematobium]